MTALTGGEALVTMLERHRIDHAFGMAGFQPLPYYDALARQQAIRHILIRDEKHGAFAADAFARVAGRPAVADATLGPGATNLVSGAAESFGASIPVIFVTGDVNRGIAGRAATQESDQIGMLRPAMKEVLFIDRIERIPELVRRAFTIATGGRPGPVLIDIPEDVFHGSGEFSDELLYADDAVRALGGRRIRPDEESVERAARLLAVAERPAAILGGGIHLAAASRRSSGSSPIAASRRPARSAARARCATTIRSRSGSAAASRGSRTSSSARRTCCSSPAASSARSAPTAGR